MTDQKYKSRVTRKSGIRSAKLTRKDAQTSDYDITPEMASQAVAIGKQYLEYRKEEKDREYRQDQQEIKKRIR